MTTYADIEGFADQIGERRRRAEALTPALLSVLETAADADVAAAERGLAASVHATTDLLAGTLDDLGRAEEELRVQNEALFTAHTELEREHQTFRDLFEYAPVAYVVTTDAGLLTRINHAAATLLGRSANMLVGKPLSTYVALVDRAAFRAALVRSASSPRAETWRVRFLPKGCDTVECRVHTRVVAPVTVVGSDAACGGSMLHWVITEEPWDALDDLV